MRIDDVLHISTRSNFKLKNSTIETHTDMLSSTIAVHNQLESRNRTITRTTRSINEDEKEEKSIVNTFIDNINQDIQNPANFYSEVFQDANLRFYQIPINYI